MHVIMSREL
jgi:uncharacterized membrane protein YphA (DoxX/SURF4 family)